MDYSDKKAYSKNTINHSFDIKGSILINGQQQQAAEKSNDQPCVVL
jgi:hypothetical protein